MEFQVKVADLQARHASYQTVQAVKQNAINTAQKAHEEKHQAIGSFAEVFQKTIEKQEGLRFSGHAIKRMSERNIHLTPTDLGRLESGLESVKEKGSKSSLLLMDEMAYVVSVKNETVITAMDKQSTVGNVFTNIDSVAII